MMRLKPYLILRDLEASHSAPADYIAIVDKFSFKAFLFPPILCLWRGMLLWAILSFALWICVAFLLQNSLLQYVAYTILIGSHLWFGFELQNLTAEHYIKNGYELSGLIDAPDEQAAIALFIVDHPNEMKPTAEKKLFQPTRDTAPNDPNGFIFGAN